MPADGLSGLKDCSESDRERILRELRPIVWKASKLASESEKYKDAIDGELVTYDTPQHSHDDEKMLHFVYRTYMYREETDLSFVMRNEDERLRVSNLRGLRQMLA